METVQLFPGVFRFHDDTDSTFYLIVGQRKALAIDTGTGHVPVLPEMRKRTDLPIELAVTHAHGDHFGASREFDAVYMHPADIALLPEMEERFKEKMGVPPVRRDTLRPITGGDEIDLGGVKLLVLEIGGHTPGSIALLDPTRKLVFTGDAIGSGLGVWMQVFQSLPVAVYRENLSRFRARVAPYPGLTFLGGHYTQAGTEGTERYNPPCIEMLDDMIALCDRALAGKAEEAEVAGLSFTSEEAVVAKFGRAKMVYMRSHLL